MKTHERLLKAFSELKVEELEILDRLLCYESESIREFFDKKDGISKNDSIVFEMCAAVEISLSGKKYE